MTLGWIYLNSTPDTAVKIEFIKCLHFIEKPAQRRGAFCIKKFNIKNFSQIIYRTFLICKVIINPWTRKISIYMMDQLQEIPKFPEHLTTDNSSQSTWRCTS